MASVDEMPKAGSRRQVARPFRAVGRVVRRAWEFVDLLDAIVLVARGIAVLFRAVGKVISGILDAT